MGMKTDWRVPPLVSPLVQTRKISRKELQFKSDNIWGYGNTGGPDLIITYCIQKFNYYIVSYK